MTSRAQFKPGEFSLGQSHEFVGAFGRQGGSPHLLQAAIEDEELMEKVVNLLRKKGYELSESQQMAKSVLPKGHYFGPEEWYRFFGYEVSFSKPDLVFASLIPWVEKELRKPRIKQPHFLFLSVERLGEKLVTLETLRKRFETGSDSHPKFNLHPHLANDWYIGRLFAREPVRFRWCWMPVGAVVGSVGVDSDMLPKMLPAGYEIPTESERALANVLFCLLNDRYLDQKNWVLTKENFRMIGDQEQGILVVKPGEVFGAALGLAANRVVGGS